MGTDIDAEALSTFLAVHRQKGFSNAARFLHRTQPAISRRIALLGWVWRCSNARRAASR
jgi:hypothetical protein